MEMQRFKFLPACGDEVGMKWGERYAVFIVMLL